MSEITREQFMLGQAIAGVLQATNPPFCAEDSLMTTGDSEVNKDQNYIRNVARVAAKTINYSHMMVDDLIIVLQTMHDVIREHGEHKEVLSKPTQELQPKTKNKKKTEAHKDRLRTDLTKEDWQTVFEFEFVRRCGITLADADITLHRAAKLHWPETTPQDAVLKFMEKYDLDDVSNS